MEIKQARFFELYSEDGDDYKFSVIGWQLDGEDREDFVVTCIYPNGYEEKYIMNDSGKAPLIYKIPPELKRFKRRCERIRRIGRG